jgi:Pentapeptide repeats (8 copies)
MGAQTLSGKEPGRAVAAGALEDKAWLSAVGSTSQIWSRRTVSTFPYYLVACPHRVWVCLYGLYAISGILKRTSAREVEGIANPEHVEIVKQGKEAIAAWREAHPSERLDLRRADLEGANLSCADLGGANLGKADLSGANLAKAYLGGSYPGGCQARRSQPDGSQPAGS